MALLRVALAQVNPIMGNFKYNLRLIQDVLEQARARQTDLVVFPELILCGYPPEDLLLRPGFIDDAAEAMTTILPHTKGLAAVVGYPTAKDKKLYNAAALLVDGRHEADHYKIELPNYGVFDEKRYFDSGNRPLIFEINQIRLGVTICEDIWIDNGACEQALAPLKLDGLINLAASPFHAQKINERKEILNRVIQKSKAAVIYVNLTGGQDELVFDGGSMVIDHQHRILAQAEHFQEQVLFYDLTIDPTVWPMDKQLQHKFTFNQSVDRSVQPAPYLAQIKNGVEEIYQALVTGTHDYVKKNNFSKVIVGLSGGIDSAVTAAIAVAALGQDHVKAISMPSQYSSSATQNDAQLLAGQLGIDLEIISIQPLFEQYQARLSTLMAQQSAGPTLENIQARIRGNFLMAWSNQQGYLVLTTGNKSETAVGYCTLYGDMAGGFAILKDVYKTTVYELSAFINQQAGRLVIPMSIIKRAPSAELKDNQTDQDSLPAYAVLDPILKAYIEKHHAPETIVAAGFDQDTVLEVIQKVDRNEYKRRQAPPGIKLTPRAFGRDWRLPITNQYTNHLLDQYDKP